MYNLYRYERHKMFNKSFFFFKEEDIMRLGIHPPNRV